MPNDEVEWKEQKSANQTNAGSALECVWSTVSN